MMAQERLTTLGVWTNGDHPRKGEGVPKESSLHVALAQAVRELRAQRALSQESFALQSGLHPNYYGGLERAERNPTLEVLCRLANGYDLKVSELMELAERQLTR